MKKISPFFQGHRVLYRVSGMSLRIAVSTVSNSALATLKRENYSTLFGSYIF